MGSEANLKSWVSDKLMTLLGYSQPTLVQYIIGLCKYSICLLQFLFFFEENRVCVLSTLQFLLMGS